VVAALGDGCGDGCPDGSGGEPRVAAGCCDGCGRTTTALGDGCGDASAPLVLRQPPAASDQPATTIRLIFNPLAFAANFWL